MPIYNFPPPCQRLDVFFADMFGEMRNAPPEAYGGFLMRAEEEFRRTGFREASAGTENILIVRLDEIGDQVLTSGFIREVRANFPYARITLVVAPFIRPMVELCPYVNEILVPKVNSFQGSFNDLIESIAVFCRDNLWQKKFSYAFSPKWDGVNFPALLMMWLSGARERIGYGYTAVESWYGKSSPQAVAQDKFLMTKNVITPRNIITRVEDHFYLLTATGFKVSETHMELWFGEEDARRAGELLAPLSSADKKIILGIGAGKANKKYPVDKYLVALRELVKRDLAFIILGGRNELDEATFLEQNLPQDKVLNLVGKTTLRETEAVVSLSDFYIGNDTGVMHMAAAAQIPVLSIYRDADDRQNILPGVLSPSQSFAPWRTKSAILRPAHPLGACATLPPVVGHCHYDVPHCITQIPPQAIIEAFEALQAL